MADTTSVFGVDIPGPDPAALAGAQQTFQQLDAAARQLRAAAAQATDPAVAEYARRVAEVADAAARGDTPDLQTAVSEVANFVAGHPELFGAQVSSVTGLALLTISQWSAAIDLISQASDAASAAKAVDATADAVGQTGTMVAVIAGIIGGGPLGAAIGAVVSFLVSLAHHLASLIRGTDDAAPGSDESAGTSPAGETGGTDDQTRGTDRTETDRTGTDQTGTDQTGTDRTGTDRTGTDQTIGTGRSTGTDTGSQAPTGPPGGGGRIDYGPGSRPGDTGHDDGTFPPPAVKKKTEDGT